jgi:ABC-2 type transport system ATP-binding protein
VKQDFKQNIFSIQLSQLPTHIQSESFTVVEEKNNKLFVKINEGYKSNDVLRYFLSQQVNIEGFNEILPSLNEIFIQLVEGTHAVTRSFQKVS